VTEKYQPIVFDGEPIRVGFWKSDGFATPKLTSSDDWLSRSVGRALSEAIQRSLLAAIEASLPSVFDHIDREWDAKERERVLSYVSDVAFRKESYFGESTCRMCGKLDGSADYSDGKFLWPEGLAHCIREHGVRPPPTFVRHVQRAMASRI
jgi:hypothetical protein